MSRKSRPNSNYILQVMRDDDIAGDPFGTAMSWAFSCAENLAAFGAEVPSELGYRMGAGGPCVESYSDFEVAEYLGAEVDHETETANFDPEVATISDDVFQDRIAEVQFAGRCLHRYIDWCKAAGKDY